MRRKISVLMVIIMIFSAVALSSCGGDESSSSSDQSVVSSDPGSSSDSAEVSADASEENNELEKNEDASSDTADQNASASSPEGETNSSGNIDASKLLEVPDSVKGYLIGNWLSDLDNKKGFGIEVSGSIEELGGAASVKIYIKDDKLSFGTKLDASFLNEDVTVIYKDSKIYSLDNKNKTYKETPNSFEIPDFTNIKDYVFSKVEDKELDGVVYKVESFKDEIEGMILYYFLNGELKFIELEGVMLKVDFCDEVSDEMFDIPSDYEVEKAPKLEDVFALPEEYKDLAFYKALEKYNTKDGFYIFMISGDEEYKSEEKIYIKGESIRYETTNEFDGEILKSVTLYKDGKSFSIYDDEKTYVESLGYIEELSYILNAFKYSKTETKEIDGVEYTVDVFELNFDFGEDMFLPEFDMGEGTASEGYFGSASDGFGEGDLEYEYDMSLKLYTKDGELKYMESMGQMVSVQVSNLENVSDDMFEIPEGYEPIPWENMFDGVENETSSQGSSSSQGVGK